MDRSENIIFALWYGCGQSANFWKRWRHIIAKIIRLCCCLLSRSSGYSLYGVLHVLHMSLWVSSRFSSFLKPLKNMLIGGLAWQNCPWVWMSVRMMPCNGLVSHPAYPFLPNTKIKTYRRWINEEVLCIKYNVQATLSYVQSKGHGYHFLS